MFDLEQIKRESGLAADVLARLEAAVRQEFRDDEMMFELHFLRTVTALKAGWIRLEEALADKVMSR